MKKFEVGKRYGMNSICDSDCWWYYTVIERTACTITLKSDRGEIIKCRMNSKRNEIYGCEVVRPLGSYSMCPTLTAEKEMPKDAKPVHDVQRKPEPVKQEEHKAVIIPLSAHGTLVIGGVKVCEFHHTEL